MSGSGCNSTSNPLYWSQEPTAIFVVWDDWGGWFDHVPPATSMVYRSNDPGGCNSSDSNAPNGWGCGYVYGFRVPLLVVSEYTKVATISGSCTNNCPNNVFPFVHDFGSILAFTEYNFGMKQIYPNTTIYADYGAPDWSADHKTHVPLSDFFSLSNVRTFTSITTEKDYKYFQNHSQYNSSWVPDGPDGGDSD